MNGRQHSAQVLVSMSVLACMGTSTSVNIVIFNNCHGSGEKLHNVLLWGLASYISAQKGGLEGSIHYPSGKMPNLTYSYTFLPRVAG